MCLSLEFLDSGDTICVYGKVLIETRPDVGLVVVNVQGSLRTRQSQLAQRPYNSDVQRTGAL